MVLTSWDIDREKDRAERLRAKAAEEANRPATAAPSSADAEDGIHRPDPSRAGHASEAQPPPSDADRFNRALELLGGSRVK